MITAHFLAEWALRSSILILCGAALLRVLRVQDASVRLAAYTALLCGSVALPALKVSLPSFSVPAPAVTLPAAPPPVMTGRTLIVELPAAPAAPRFDWVVAAYIVVAGALLLRLALGLTMSRRLLRRSRPTPEADVREADHVASPVTLGIVRPIVVLPADWREWSASRLAAVLAHERSHIRRHDPGIQLLSAIHRALLWYSPLSWYLDREIVRTAERASDDAAIAAVEDRVSYAETLLEFMQRAARRESWQGVPMARYAEPEHRIDRILDATSLSRGITRWTIAAILALGLPLAYVIAAAQERLTFEAASVKPTTPPPCLAIVDGTVAHLTGTGMDCSPYDNKGGPGTGDPGRIHIPVIPLRGLLKRAYQEYFDVKSPDWADNDVMALDATMPPNTTKEQFQTMLQNLLIDRFALKTHVETKEITGYGLTVAKDGPKVKDAPPDNEPDATFRDHKGQDGFPVTDPQMRGTAIMSAPGERMRLAGPHATMTELSKELGSLLDSVVQDRTGLNGYYNLTMNFAGHMGGHQGGSALQQPPAPTTDPGAPEPFPDIFSALQTQLGLKLEKQKVSVEIVVVDHMEKTPVGN